MQTNSEDKIIDNNEQSIKQTVNCILLGLDNSGKTSIVKRLDGEDLEDIKPTKGFSFRKFEWESKSIDYTVWDIGGQKLYRDRWQDHLQDKHGVIWVIDSLDKSRFEESKEELHRILSQDGADFQSLLVLANKQDIKDQQVLSTTDIRDNLGLDDFYNDKFHWRCMGCSALEDTGLDDALKWIVSDMNQFIN